MLNSDWLPVSQEEPMISLVSPCECNIISGKQARHELHVGGQGYLTMMYRDDENAGCSNVFPSELPDVLPPQREMENDITNEPEAKPPSKPAYRLSQSELDELQLHITDLLKKGIIEPSKSPYGAPVFFVRKSDGTLRMVCDWRELNKITIKNQACLPSIDDLFDTVQGNAYFTKLDLRSGYNQIRINDADVPKTAINTTLGHFQFRVMGFGLTNAPATFQSLLNSIVSPYLRKFIVVFLDDILIFTRAWEEHFWHIQTVPDAMRENQLYGKLTKWKVRSVLFLGHQIDGEYIRPDPRKPEAVQRWPAPTSISEVWQFLGFTSYCRGFIRHFQLYSDSMAVVHLRTKPHLSKREARWVECLADFDFTVYHHPGRVNIADALSRRSDLVMPWNIPLISILI